MYEQVIPFKDYKNNPRNMKVQLNLDEREIFKLFPEFQRVLSWRDSLMGEDIRELSPEEVRDFYNDLEEILLAAWGELSEDGLNFVKTDKYKFESSALFNALMVMFVTDQAAANKMIDALLPKGLQDLITKQKDNLEKAASNPETPEAIQARIRELQAQLPKDSASE